MLIRVCICICAQQVHMFLHVRRTQCKNILKFIAMFANCKDLYPADDILLFVYATLFTCTHINTYIHKYYIGKKLHAADCRMTGASHRHKCHKHTHEYTCKEMKLYLLTHVWVCVCVGVLRKTNLCYPSNHSTAFHVARGSRKRKSRRKGSFIHSFTCAEVRIFTLDGFSDEVIATANKNSFDERLIFEINSY